MRCWPPPTEVIKAPVKVNLCAYWEQQDSWRDLPSTAEKQDVSSAGFQGIFSPFTQRYSDIPVWGYHYPWRVLHAVETLGAQGTRWLNTLSKKDRDILGKTCGVFGYPEATLKEIGMYQAADRRIFC